MRIRDYPEVSRAGPVSSGRWGVRAAVAQRPVWVRAELAVVIAYRGWEAAIFDTPATSTSTGLLAVAAPDAPDSV